MELETVHAMALSAAQTATETHIQNGGSRDACGFAWVTCGERGNTKLGKAMIKLGFKKNYGSKGSRLWNPSGSHTQAITAKEKGAEAYVQVMKQYYPALDIYSESRMD